MLFQAALFITIDVIQRLNNVIEECSVLTLITQIRHDKPIMLNVNGKCSENFVCLGTEGLQFEL